MAIRVVCPSCGKQFGARPEHAGKRAKCPGCATVLTIPAAQPGGAASGQAGAKPASGAGAKPAPRPGAGTPIRPTAPAPEPSSMGSFLDDELTMARPASPESQATQCPVCGRPYAPGEDKCRVCEGGTPQKPRREETSAPAFDPFMMSSRFAPDDAATARRKGKEARADMISGWLVKGGSVAFVGGILLFLVIKFWVGMGHTEIVNVLGPNVSDGHVLNSNAGWLDLNLERLPGYVDGCERGTTKTDATGTGIWVYTIKSDREQNWELAKAEVNPGSDGKPLREEHSLMKMWMNQLFTMGYFKEGHERPPPILITEFTIREPNGRTWVLGMDGSEAKKMCNLANMLGCQNCKADLAPLMHVKRGSLAYAVFFSPVNQRTPLDQKLAKSCDPDDNVRTFAAEMLLSTLPQLPTDAKSPGVGKEQYEAMLTQLAQATTPDEKTNIYEQLRGSAAAP